MCFLFGRSQRLLLMSSTQCNRKVSNACTALWSSDTWLAVKPCMVRNSETQWALGGQLDIYIESHVTVTRCFVGYKFSYLTHNLRGFTRRRWIINLGIENLKCCCCDIILVSSFLLNVELLLTRLGLSLDLIFELIGLKERNHWIIDRGELIYILYIPHPSTLASTTDAAQDPERNLKPVRNRSDRFFRQCFVFCPVPALCSTGRDQLLVVIYLVICKIEFHKLEH